MLRVQTVFLIKISFNFKSLNIVNEHDGETVPNLITLAVCLHWLAYNPSFKARNFGSPHCPVLVKSN